MSTFLTVGVAHHDAELGRLERVAAAFGRSELQARALAAGCAEVLVLSTCSRIELHAVLDASGPDHRDHRDYRDVAALLAQALTGGIDGSAGFDLPSDTTLFVGDDAVRHLFRVAAGLDSRIVGEAEVQAQLRIAARAATATDGEPHRLRRVVAAALAAARQTAGDLPGLLRRGLLAERAVERALAGHLRPDEPAESDESDEPVASVESVVVGAGTMGRQVVTALQARRCRSTLLSRTCSAKAGGPSVHPLEELPSRLAGADVLFVATSAGRRILSSTLVREILDERPERPLTIVDLSLPRNVDPAVVAVPGVRLLDLDDLGDDAETAPDPAALDAAEAATEAAARRYCAEIRSRRAGPVITALRNQVEEVCLDQLRRTTKGIALPDEALARMASAVAGAVAHSPTLLARQAAAEDDAATLALIASAFRLGEAI